MTSAEGISPEQKAALETLLASEPLRSVLSCLTGRGEEARIVGGAVRNTLMGIGVSDVDIATTCLPDETMRRASQAGFRPVPTGLEHGTITVVAKGRPFEVTTLREDIATDGRHATVRFGRDFAHDARRRDFTMNALMLSADGVLHDNVAGLRDLAARHVRFIGEPSARIREDYLRILRFFRFHAAYGSGDINAEGLAACIEEHNGLDGLSRERIRAELMKLVMAQGAVPALMCMIDCGLWQRVTGGIALAPRLMQLLQFQPEAPAINRLAVLAVMTRADAERLRLALKLSNAEHEALLQAASAFEALHGEPLIDAKQARRMAYRLGHAPFMLGMACTHPALEENAYSQLSATSSTPVFPLSGRDVMAAGLRAGPQVGQVLAAAEALWIKADFPQEQSALGQILAEAVAACR